MSASKKKQTPPGPTFKSLLVFFVLWSIIVIWPYRLILFEALLLTAILHPLYKKLLKKVKKKYIAAGISISIVGLIITLLAIILVGGLLSQTISAINSIISGVREIETNALPDSRLAKVVGQLKTNTIQTLTVMGKSVVSSAPSYLKLVSDTVIHFLLLSIATFYFLVDGDSIFCSIARYSRDGGENLRAFLTYAEEMTSTLFKGLIGVSILKGFSNGLCIYLFGVSTPLFWAIMMVILGIIPLVGPFLVWFPIGVYTIIWLNPVVGVSILLWCFISDNVMDNIIYPKIIASKRKIHPLLIIFGVFAGISTYGIAGVILGPLLFSLTASIVIVYLEAIINVRRKDGKEAFDFSKGLEKSTGHKTEIKQTCPIPAVKKK